MPKPKKEWIIKGPASFWKFSLKQVLMNVEEKLFVHITFVGKVNVPDALAALILPFLHASYFLLRIFVADIFHRFYISSFLIVLSFFFYQNWVIWQQVKMESF